VLAREHAYYNNWIDTNTINYIQLCDCINVPKLNSHHMINGNNAPKHKLNSN